MSNNHAPPPGPPNVLGSWICQWNANHDSVLDRYSSPREVALRTVQLLKLDVHNHQNFYNRDSGQKSSTQSQAKGDSADPYIQITRALQEWDYGEYEGLTFNNIHEVRKAQGLDQMWNIWEEGCPGGEYVFSLFPPPTSYLYR